MANWSAGFPEPGEYPPYAANYVAMVGDEDVVAALRSQVEETLAVIGAVDPERARSFRYAPGKWTLHEVLGHMADTERIFAYRALRIGRGDATPLPGFEQDDYVARGPFGNCTLAQLMAEFRAVRAATLCLFEAFPPEAWLRRGTTSGHPASARALACLVLGHERYHLKIIRERYL